VLFIDTNIYNMPLAKLNFQGELYMKILRLNSFICVLLISIFIFINCNNNQRDPIIITKNITIPAIDYSGYPLVTLINFEQTFVPEGGWDENFQLIDFIYKIKINGNTLADNSSSITPTDVTFF